MFMLLALTADFIRHLSQTLCHSQDIQCLDLQDTYQSNSIGNEVIDDIKSEQCCENDIKSQLELKTFDPPLYRQRHQYIAEILEKENVKSVVDLGCSQNRAIPIFKSVPTLEVIVGVDIDYKAVSSNLHLLQPLLTDYIVRRTRPLAISLYHGDAQLYDVRLAGTEAVTLIEVIEHLFVETLERVAYNVFSNIRPRLIIITTPNAEYNVVFGNHTAFRHWDHKFEWTRNEFQQWCRGLADTYGYAVFFSGVGQPPSDHRDIGYCSQVAVFKIRSDWSMSMPPESEQCMPYKLVKKCIHPYQRDKRSMEEMITMETKYYLHMLINHCLQDEDTNCNSDYCFDVVTGELKVTPGFLLNFTHLKKICPDVKTLISTLLQEGFVLTPDHTHVIYKESEDELSNGSEEEDDDDDQNLVKIIDLETEHNDKELDEISEDWTEDIEFR